MTLDDECRVCLYNSQLKKVEREQTDKEKLNIFKTECKKLCESAPEFTCAPLLMREIDLLHRRVFGYGIDYSREKTLFNGKLLKLENGLFEKVKKAENPLYRALTFSAASNYIDFARLSDLDEGAIEYVLNSAQRAELDKDAFLKFESELEKAQTLLFLHDNCGEIVLDKILIRIIKELYPKITVSSVVRGSDIINDATISDAIAVGLCDLSLVYPNGTNVPGTPLNEISPKIKVFLSDSDVIISKGLGNFETLYGEGYGAYYVFACKCRHIADRFNLPVWACALVKDEKI